MARRFYGWYTCEDVEKTKEVRGESCAHVIGQNIVLRGGKGLAFYGHQYRRQICKGAKSERIRGQCGAHLIHGKSSHYGNRARRCQGRNRRLDGDRLVSAEALMRREGGMRSAAHDELSVKQTSRRNGRIVR